jgi:hypothetical protein
MFAAILQMVGFDLERLLLRLRAEARGLIYQAEAAAGRKAADVGTTIALAAAGGICLFGTFVVALIVLYIWIAARHGELYGLLAVGAATTTMAALLFATAAVRGDRARRVPVAPVLAPPRPVAVRPPTSAASFIASLVHSLTGRTTLATEQVLNHGADLVRQSPRETVFAALAAAALVGVVIGRRR